MRYFVVILFSNLVALAPSAASEELERRGPELMVNTYTTATQGFSDIAIGPDGGFVVAWSSAGQDGDGYGIFGQAYAPNGSERGGEFQVHTTTESEQWSPAVAVDGAGRSIFIWQSFIDGQSFDVFGQRFSADGTPLGGELSINTTTAEPQQRTGVAASEDGEFLVVWESRGQDHSAADTGIYGRLYDSSGSPVTGELRLNDTTADNQGRPRIASRDGGYVVSWTSQLQDGSGAAAVVRLLDGDAAPVGGEIVVNETTAGDQSAPDVAALADGTLGVVWRSDGQDGSEGGIYGRILADNGAPLSGEFLVNTWTTGDQKNPRIAPDGAGGFIAVWTSVGQVEAEDTYARRFDAAGVPVGAALRVHAFTARNQDMPNVAGAAGRPLMVTWRDEQAPGGSARDVVAQRFGIGLFTDGFESGDSSAWTVTFP